MKSRELISRIGQRLTLRVALIAGALTLASGMARADARGVAKFGKKCAKGVCVPHGVFYHEVTGDGLTVWRDLAWAVSSRLCNWHIDFAYYDNAGRRYKNLPQAVQARCASKIQRTVSPGKLKAGRACSRLYVSGIHKATQCHNIVP